MPFSNFLCQFSHPTRLTVRLPASRLCESKVSATIDGVLFTEIHKSKSHYVSCNNLNKCPYLPYFIDLSVDYRLA
jgi:hypothetical protein